MISCKAVMDGKVIAGEVKRADRFFARLAGWMGKKQAEDGEGLLLCPCRQIHTYFMRFPIDVLFLSKSGEILHFEESMAPGKISRNVRDCAAVLELKGGTGRKKGVEPFKTITFV